MPPQRVSANRRSPSSVWATNAATRASKAVERCPFVPFLQGTELGIGGDEAPDRVVDRLCGSWAAAGKARVLQGPFRGQGGSKRRERPLLELHAADSRDKLVARLRPLQAQRFALRSQDMGAQRVVGFRDAPSRQQGVQPAGSVPGEDVDVQVVLLVHVESRHPPDVLQLHYSQALHVLRPLGAQEALPVLLSLQPERRRVLSTDGHHARDDRGRGLAQLSPDSGALRDPAGVEEGVAGVWLGDAAGTVGNVIKGGHARVLALDPQVVVGLEDDGAFPVRDIEDAGSADRCVLRAPAHCDAVVDHQLRPWHG